MDGVGTSIIGRPRRLPSDRPAAARYTLNCEEPVISRKTVARLMRQHEIRGISPRPWRPVTTIADPSPHAIPDLVERRFDRGALNVVWSWDIERHEALLNRAVVKGHRFRLVAASRKKLGAA